MVPRHDLSVGALAGSAGFALVTLAAALFAILLTRETGNVAVFWPVNGILAGVLLRLPRERHLATIAGCFLGNAAANLVHGDPLWVATGLATCNVLEAVLACELVVRLAGPSFVLGDLRQLAALFAAGLVAPAASATVAAAVFSAVLGMAPGALWAYWWVSDAVGMLLALPLITSFDVRPIERLLRGDRRLVLRTLEFSAVFGLLGGLLWLIVRADVYGTPALFTPLLLWLALRFGTCGVAAAAAAIVLTTVTAGAYEVWPLPFTPGASMASRVVPLELRAILVTMPPLVVAVLVQQRMQASRRLDDALESMADGLALYDPDRRLVLWNQRYRECLAPVADLLVPGAHFDDLVREGIRRGMYLDDGDAGAEARIAELVRARDTGTAREVRYRDGRWLQVVPRSTSDGGTVLACRDITERKRLEQTLEHMAMHDPLTDLPNRKMYDLELRRARARVAREGRRLALMLLDLDRFKEVNDTYGHQVGDQLLVAVAGRLAGSVRAGDVVARVGGDEFAVLAESSDGIEGLTALAERILVRLSEPVRLAELELEPHASLGLTVFPDDPAELDAFVAHADRALYAAKEAGGRTCRLFRDGMDPANGGSQRIVDEIGRAVGRGELDLDYQPIVSTATSQVVGIEALLRWRHPRRGRLPASGFIAAAERTPAILPLTRFVLRSALRQQRTWRDAGLTNVPLWVNLAPACLRWDGLLDAVNAALAEAGVAPDRLVLEVTERSFFDLARAESLAHQLRHLGVRLALDDFGASYSSLGRLRGLPMDVVKIDRSFIAALASDPRDRAVVQAMVTLGANLGLTPLAEGVETAEQLAILQGFGCDWAQGHLFAPPLPPGQLAPWLAAWHERHGTAPHDERPWTRTGPEAA